MFNPEKYVTRAEAAEISYRMTQTPQALAFHNALSTVNKWNKTSNVISHALHYGQDFTQFRNDGALFWKEGKIARFCSGQKHFDTVHTALADAHDPQLDNALIVKPRQIDTSPIRRPQSDALALYQNKNLKVKSLVFYQQMMHLY